MKKKVDWNKVWNWIKKELGNLGLLIIAFLLSFVVLPAGMIWALIIKPIYHCIKGDFTKANKGLGKYIGNFFYQFWNVIKLLFRYIAELIDYLGNVFAGELIEDIITPEEDTMLGRGDAMISPALGDLEAKAKKDPSKVNGRGWWLIGILNKFEKNHCNKAIRLWNYKQKLKNEN